MTKKKAKKDVKNLSSKELKKLLKKVQKEEQKRADQLREEKEKEFEKELEEAVKENKWHKPSIITNILYIEPEEIQKEDFAKLNKLKDEDPWLIYHYDSYDQYILSADKKRLEKFIKEQSQASYETGSSWSVYNKNLKEVSVSFTVTVDDIS